MIKTDVIIVGGGPVGCVLAERISSVLNLKCIIIEKRNHIAGNCYDEKNSKGLLYHKYGPHYLRFKSTKIFNYLSKFTKWISGEYIVKSSFDNKLYPIPINLDTLEMFFNHFINLGYGVWIINFPPDFKNFFSLLKISFLKFQAPKKI